MTTTAAASLQQAELAEMADFVSSATAPAPRPRRLVDALGPEALASLTRLARSLAGSRTEADDLLQDALERALRVSDRFAEESNLGCWMHTVMYRLAVDRSRRARRRKWDSNLDGLAAEPADDRDPPAWTGLGLADLRAAVAQLPDTLRAAYSRFAFENQSYDEIAAALGIQQRTVGTRLHRARAKLRILLEQNRLVQFPTGGRSTPPAPTAGRRTEAHLASEEIRGAA